MPGLRNLLVVSGTYITCMGPFGDFKPDDPDGIALLSLAISLCLPVSLSVCFSLSSLSPYPLSFLLCLALSLKAWAASNNLQLNPLKTRELIIYRRGLGASVD